MKADMLSFTFHDLQCFDAVVRAGGFQAAAQALHRSHPAVFAAVGKLERQLGVQLLDRSGYRVRTTPAGSSFHRHAQSLLREMDGLRLHAAQLAAGEETDLHVVIGDLCPRTPALGLLSRFFSNRPRTRLHLHFESVTGPRERLLDGEADLILHGVDKADVRVEWIDLCKVRMLPVAAPGFLPFPVKRTIRLAEMRPFTQCVIRDSARHGATRDYYLVEGAQQCTVADHQMKKEVILQGLAWGHLPDFLVGDELRDGRLVSLAGRYLAGSTEALVAARRADRPHGPVAECLWAYLQAHPLRAED
jgi:DNA-binding transcriptional LysR family regulator